MEGSSSAHRRTGNAFGAAMFFTPGAIMTAVVVASFAGILLSAFVQSYKKGSPTAQVNTPVFVASGYIPRGTPVSVFAAAQLLSRTTVPSSHVVVGAITDPSVIKGEVAASNIYPGQQLTTADFTASNVTVASLLSGSQRADRDRARPRHTDSWAPSRPAIGSMCSSMAPPPPAARAWSRSIRTFSSSPRRAARPAAAG